MERNPIWTEGSVMPGTRLYEVFFTLGTEGQGKALETRCVIRAASKEAAIEKVIERHSIPAEAITGAGTY